MLVQFGNNWIQKIPLTAKLDSACGLVQFWLSSEFFSSNYFQIGQHVVLLHILMQFSPSAALLLIRYTSFNKLCGTFLHKVHVLALTDFLSCRKIDLECTTAGLN